MQDLSARRFSFPPPQRSWKFAKMSFIHIKKKSKLALLSPSPNTLLRCWTPSTVGVLPGRCSVPPPLRRRPIKINRSKTAAAALLLSLAGCLFLFFLFSPPPVAAPVKNGRTLWTGSEPELCHQTLEQQTVAHAFLISHRFEAGGARSCPIDATSDPR